MSERIHPSLFPHVRNASHVGQIHRAGRGRESGNSVSSFSEVLQNKLGELRFSAHAQQRMASRGIHLDPEDEARLREAVDKAQAKGARDSLILLRDMAFVVSVENRTVITALDGQSLRENVFTNIDSAVVM